LCGHGLGAILLDAPLHLVEVGADVLLGTVRLAADLCLETFEAAADVGELELKIVVELINALTHDAFSFC
jgi:hypothetical protein